MVCFLYLLGCLLKTQIMKLYKLSLLLVVVFLSSCSTVRVTADYDTKKDFNNYKTFAFYKNGIDKAAISDLDKRRILRAVESELLLKGFTKSENPDMLVSIFTKSRKRVDVATVNNYNGFFWYPMYYRDYNRVQVSKYTEGTLFIDLIDSKSNQLVWQGIGTGVLNTRNVSEKQERINEFVKEIMNQYPPKIK